MVAEIPYSPQGGVPSQRRHLLYLAVAVAILIAALLAASRLAALSRSAWPQKPTIWVDLTEPGTGGSRAEEGRESPQP